jgi:hypothetical protein
VEPFIEKVSMKKLLEQLNAGTCTRLPPKIEHELIHVLSRTGQR